MRTHRTLELRAELIASDAPGKSLHDYFAEKWVHKLIWRKGMLVLLVPVPTPVTLAVPCLFGGQYGIPLMITETKNAKFLQTGGRGRVVQW